MPETLPFYSLKRCYGSFFKRNGEIFHARACAEEVYIFSRFASETKNVYLPGEIEKGNQSGYRKSIKIADDAKNK